MTKTKFVARKGYKFNRFFPRSNFTIGMGSVLNIAGNYFDFKYATTAQDEDMTAIASDWFFIGEDIERARSSFALQNSSKPLRSNVR